MKRVGFIFILVILFLDSNGQWYKSKYGVSNINQLTKPQLEESLTKSKSNSTLGLMLIITGIICIPVGSVYFHKSKYPTEDVLSYGLINGIRAIGSFTVSAITIVPGTVLLVNSNNRYKSIKPVLKNYDRDHGSLSISPAVLINSYTSTYSPGITLKFGF